MKTVRVLILTLSLALLLGGCAAGGGTADSSSSAEGPTESQPVTDAPEAPSPLRDIVLEGVNTPGLMPDVAGFEHSLWGDSVSDVASCKPSSSWTLMDNSAALGGFPCQAYYIFDEDGLTGGYYLLNAGEEYGPALFRSVLDYLTGLYGDPSKLYDGEYQEVTDPDTAFDDGLGTVIWSGTPFETLKAGTVGIVLYGFPGGEVRVAFTGSSTR